MMDRGDRIIKRGGVSGRCGEGINSLSPGSLVGLLRIDTREVIKIGLDSKKDLNHKNT